MTNAETLRVPNVAIAASMAAVALSFYIQHHVIPGKAETTVRSVIGISGRLAVPLLIVLAFRAWNELTRHELPSWRNGLGLSAMVIISLNWLCAVALLISESIRPDLMRILSADFGSILLYSTLAAALLAVALKRGPRSYVIAAAAWMWACLQSGIYF